MAIELPDDGTLDTVVRCSRCGEEMRYNYDGSDTAETAEEPAETDPEALAQAYDVFVEWAQEDAEDQHDCPKLVRCDRCEMCSINGLACHETSCPNARKVWDADNREWVRPGAEEMDNDY